MRVPSRLLAALLLLAACSSPERRIKHHRALFESYPPEAQAKIKEGKVALGFTEPMVLMALGKPDRRYTRSSEAGGESVWAYTRGGSGVGIGLGSVFGTGGSVFGGGVSIGTGQSSPEERTRVVFREGKVVTVEARER